MDTFGDATRVNPDGSSSELRFIVEDDIRAIVYNNHIANLTVSQNGAGVNLLEVHLTAPRGMGLLRLPTDATVEVWFHRVGESSHRVAVVSIDYFNSEYKAEEAYLEIHGRSPCARLIDAPVNVEFHGSLHELLRKVAGSETMISSSVPESRVSAYVAAPSAYGALRLVATSIGLVVSDNIENFRIRSKKEAIYELKKKPKATITEKETIQSTMRKGSPIRKR